MGLDPALGTALERGLGLGLGGGALLTM